MSIFESSRKYSIVSYGHRHGLLLLRSGRDDEHSTRVEVLFQDVRAMEIRCWTEGLYIEEISAERLDGFASNPRQMLEPGVRAYSVRGQDWHGFVLGGVLNSAEDEGSYWDPSTLLSGGARGQEN